MVVCVAALDKYTGEVKTATSCEQEDSQRYAKYYRSVGYNARVLTYEQLNTLLEAEKAERARQERMCKNGLQVL